MIDLEQYKKFGGLVVMVMGLLMIVITGTFFGIVYYTLDQTDTALRTADCTIDNNTLVSSCQELFELGVYPFLALRNILVWLSFFLIFGVTIGILLSGYQAGRSPVLMGILYLFLAGLTYIAIEVSNIYRTMLAQPLFQQIMVEFTVYNRLMLVFPWYVFIVALFALMLSIVNFQRSPVNAPTEVLDY